MGAAGGDLQKNAVGLTWRSEDIAFVLHEKLTPEPENFL
jgi:hypothetical protein